MLVSCCCYYYYYLFLSLFLGLELFQTLIRIRERIEYIWAEEGHKPMEDLTPDEQFAYTQSTTCHICDQEIVSQQTSDDYDKWMKEEGKGLSQQQRRLPVNLGPKGEYI